MATEGPPLIPLSDADNAANSAVKRPWLTHFALSSIGDDVEKFLAQAGFDRAPWLVVSFAGGIAVWFALDTPWQWVAYLGASFLLALSGFTLLRGETTRSAMMVAIIGISLSTAAGMTTIWARSEMVGQPAIEYPRVEHMSARILKREEQPADNRVRLTLATRIAEEGRAIKVRVNVPLDRDVSGAEEGATIRLRARLMPPASPILPGAYDFARRAWFDGLAATGTLIGYIEVIESAERNSLVASAQRSLSSHVREQVDGAPGTIAAAFASGDRGAISEADEVAMRDAGLTHLLSISGLHVSAVIAAAYFVAMRLLALWPALILRVRLPLLAAGIAALAGIAYTLLTGAQVPTVRSCVGAVLVLIALALGREPLSMRMVAVAAMVVLLLWPESLVGPSFQMSFAAVIAIVALHGAPPVRAFLAPRDESAVSWMSRRILMLFITGLVIEIALMPIVLFHFHRAGIYGAVANVIAIPLVTFVSMPLIAIALVLDQVGLGTPIWWLVEKSLDLLLSIAHFTSTQPGAVKLLPEIGIGTLMIFVIGGLWLALWQGRARLLGLVPVAVGAIAVIATPTPDILITRDGRHVAVTGETDQLLVLREGRSSYARDNLLELAGANGEVLAINNWGGAQCSREFCVLNLARGERDWNILMARNQELVDERQLAAACKASDIVIADRFLPRSCSPRWLKADRRFLDKKGGLSLFLAKGKYRSVADGQGSHGWWRGDPR